MSQPRTRYAKPRLEPLEERITPTDLTFMGTNSADWGDQENWTPNIVPTKTDVAIFNGNSPNCTALSTDTAYPVCARLVNLSYDHVLTFQLPFTIYGYLAADYAVSNWSGGQINQVIVGLNGGSITLIGGEFQWTGGSWNAPPSQLEDVYLTGGAQLDMYQGARTFGSNLFLGDPSGTTGNLKVGSNDSNALTGNVSFANGAGISLYAGSSIGFIQGSTSSATVGGLTATQGQSITSYGYSYRNSPGNAAVVCGLGIGMSDEASLKLTDQSKFNVTGAYGAEGNSVQQNTNCITEIGVNAVLTVPNSYYQSGGELQTDAASTQGSLSYSYITGNVYVVGGYVIPAVNGTESRDNSSVLVISGSLTLGGTVEVDFAVNGSKPNDCDAIQASGTIRVNAFNGDHAYIVVNTLNAKPASQSKYNLLWAEQGLTGYPFDATKNRFVGQQNSWILSAIPGSNPFSITAP